VRGVAGLPAKLALAADWGAEVFAVAEEQESNPALAEQARELGVELLPLPGRNAHPLRALRPLARRLAVQPGELEYLGRVGDEAEQKRQRDAFYRDGTAYYHLLRNDLADPERAAAFYRATLLPAIAAERRRQVGAADLVRPWRLLTILSGSPELVELAASIFQPRRCLVLYTDQTRPFSAEACRRVAEVARACVVEDPEEVGRDLRPGTVSRCVHAFADDGPGDELLLDLTPGTKLMTLALAQDAARAGCRRFYLMSEMRSAEIQFGSEEVVFL
jgi:hypothetical protein